MRPPSARFVPPHRLVAPLPGLRLVPTSDGGSFAAMPTGWTGLPVGDHPGAFGVPRRHHRHEGVDLYCPEGGRVTALEDGVVTAVAPFTGPVAGSPWWLDTSAVVVEGPSGAVLYGELYPGSAVRPGATLRRGDAVGAVARVLRRDKGRPTAMLHVELHAPGTREAVAWDLGSPRPPTLRDPTPLLMEAARRGWAATEAGPAFLKAGHLLVPLGDVAALDLAEAPLGRVRLRLRSGSEVVALGLDAIEAVMATRPSAVEGRPGPALRWPRGAWAFHNVVAHPLMQVLAWVGRGRLGVRLHDWSTPVPRDPATASATSPSPARTPSPGSDHAAGTIA